MAIHIISIGVSNYLPIHKVSELPAGKDDAFEFSYQLQQLSITKPQTNFVSGVRSDDLKPYQRHFSFTHVGAVSDIVESKRATFQNSEDIFLVYYSGHAIVEGGDLYFFSQVDNKDLQEKIYFKDFDAAFQGTTRAYFLDCCHSGVAGAAAKGLGALSAHFGCLAVSEKREAPPKERVVSQDHLDGDGYRFVFCSSQANEKSFRVRDSKLSQWTTWLLDAFRSSPSFDTDWSTTAFSLAAELDKKARLAELPQSPTFYTDSPTDRGIVCVDPVSSQLSQSGANRKISSEDRRAIAKCFYDSLRQRMKEQRAFDLVEFGSGARDEFHQITGNINFLCIIKDPVFLNKLDKSIEGFYEEVRKKVFDKTHIRASIHSVYSDDKKARRELIDLNILFLHRGPNYIEYKLKDQPFFVLNIKWNFVYYLYTKDTFDGGETFERLPKDCDVSNPFSTYTDDYITINISLDSLISGTGGLESIRNYLVSSRPLLETNFIGFIRSWKYAVIRTSQIVLFVNGQQKNVTLHQDIISAVLKAKVPTLPDLMSEISPAFDEVMRLDKNLTNYSIKTVDWPDIYKWTLQLINSALEYVKGTREDQKTQYLGYKDAVVLATELEKGIDRLASTGVFSDAKWVLVLTQSNDEVLGAKIAEDLIKDKTKLNTRLIVHESPEVMQRFNVKRPEAQFRYASEMSEIENPFVLVYVGSGTVVGRMIQESILAYEQVCGENLLPIPNAKCCMVTNMNPTNKNDKLWKSELYPTTEQLLKLGIKELIYVDTRSRVFEARDIMG